MSLRPGVRKGSQFEDTEEKANASRKNHSWSKMLARVFKIDVTHCPCGGTLRLMAAIQDRDQVRRYLTHANIDPDPPARAPPQFRAEPLDFS